MNMKHDIYFNAEEQHSPSLQRENHSTIKFAFKNINLLFESKTCPMKTKVGNFKKHEPD